MTHGRADESATLAALAADAPGDAVTSEALAAPLVEREATESAASPETLASLLEVGERPRYLLTGMMLDRVLDDGSRRRRMAARNRAVLTLITDRSVHFVVQYEDRFEHVLLPLERIRDVAVDTAGRERRLRIRTDGDGYDIYPGRSSDEEVEGAVASLAHAGDTDASVTEPESERETQPETGVEPTADGDGLSALERLVNLYERGHLTDEEFVRAKRELL